MISCGIYDSDGIYVNRYNRQVQFDSITGQRIIIKYIPVYKNITPYYNHYYDIWRYPRPYRFQYNYPNHYSPSSNNNSIPSSIPSPQSGGTPSVSSPSSSKSKGGNIQ